MNNFSKTNLAASVRQRLLNLKQQRQEEFGLILSQYAIERLLFRLSQSSVANQFILKGATLFAVWTGKFHRPTQDIDLLGYGDSSGDTVRLIFADLCELPVEADGLIFDTGSIHLEDIREGLEYGGHRVNVTAYLDTARIPVQIDIGFGDVVTPGATWLTYPTLLPFPAPYLRTYPKETVVAEKLHAMVEYGLGNSRMKDFYDLWTLSRLFAFDGAILVQAIAATFGQRKTLIPPSTPTALTAEFAAHPFKLTQWQAFLRRNRLEVDGASFAQVIEQLNRFLLPPLQSLVTAQAFHLHWTPPDQWQ
ncbi:MAG: nucleotidyl transferase AbiEii/AbiGii toxin family protein [Caldilinea sp. CFX5]|nr:nucleotidyl transferase AbiEii/AbiGii toxin family protein [Caldilinea sp. CFX5]